MPFKAPSKLKIAEILTLKLDHFSGGRPALLDEVGAHTLVPSQGGFKAKELINLLLQAARNGAARGTLVIIDTLKKFVNLMDKRQSAEFANACRQFVAAGGTILGLAHVNKRRSDDGKVMFAGTTDILDDFDAGYILDEVCMIEGTGERLVQFSREKARGGGVQSVAYSYAAEDGLSYAERLASVKRAEPSDVDELKRVEEERSNADVIAAVSKCIDEGVNTKMKLTYASAERAGVSRRDATKVIERYTGEDPDQHYWSFSKGARGAMIYSLIGAAERGKGPSIG